MSEQGDGEGGGAPPLSPPDTGHPGPAGPGELASFDERLERLERTVAALSTEVAWLRQAREAGHVPSPTGPASGSPGTMSPGPGPMFPGAAATAAGAAGAVGRAAGSVRGGGGGGEARGGVAGGLVDRRRAQLRAMDLEGLVGRYGTLVLGSLTIVLGVGAFLSWAVQRITLGPAARVALGAVGAALVAALGLWMRGRGEGSRRFGNVLLALALALVHVVAWAAGPGLHVLPATVALLASAVASALLAALAWRGGEQSLFVVGVGGALLAPFVTADQVGDPVLLLGYGWLVVSAAAAAMRDWRWPWSQRLLVTGVLAYAGAGLDIPWSYGLAAGVPWAGRVGPALFVLACVTSAFAVAGRGARSVLARLWLLVLLVPLLARGTLAVGAAPRWGLVAIAAVGTVAVYLALRLQAARQTLAGASAMGQPPLLLLAAFVALPTPLGREAALVAAGWAALAALAAWDARHVRRWMDDPGPGSGRHGGPKDPTPVVPGVTHLFVAGVLSLLAVSLALRHEYRLGAPAVVAHALLAALLLRRVRHPLLFLPPVFGLLLGAAWAHDLLDARTAYAYLPFVGTASLSALAVVAGWWAAGFLLRDALDTPSVGPRERAFLALLGPIAAFVWIQVELERAFSPERAAFLLIAYYATTGVLLIGIGRSRDRVGLRRTGLGLAVLAAFMAIARASGFDSVGLRVGSYLLVGCFLLAVAYWYRAAGTERGDPMADGVSAPAGVETG